MNFLRYFLNTWFIRHWKIAGVLQSPKGILFHSNSPQGVIKAVTSRNLGSISTCQYLLAKSSKVNYPAPLKLANISVSPSITHLLYTALYLIAVSVSAYSLVSLVARLAPLVRPGGSFLSLTYMASERAVPGYGGGMSSAKAALESDTRTLAFEAGRKYGVRVNTISAGPLASRAASAIGDIDKMVEYYAANAPLPERLTAREVGTTAAFLASPLASGISGATIYVDKGYHAMGVAVSAGAVL